MITRSKPKSYNTFPHPSLLPRLSFTPDFSNSFPRASHRNGERGLQTVHHMLALLLLPPHALPLLQCGVPPHGRQFSTSVSSVGPSQCFTNGSSVGASHGYSLSGTGCCSTSLMEPQVLPQNLLQCGLLSMGPQVLPGACSSAGSSPGNNFLRARPPAPAWGLHGLQVGICSTVASITAGTACLNTGSSMAAGTARLTMGYSMAEDTACLTTVCPMAAGTACLTMGYSMAEDTACLSTVCPMAAGTACLTMGCCTGCRAKSSALAPGAHPALLLHRLWALHSSFTCSHYSLPAAVTQQFLPFPKCILTSVRSHISDCLSFGQW